MKQTLLRSLLSLFVISLHSAGIAQSTDWTWSPAGPIYTAGRARNMIVDRLDASGKTLYVGSASSGIFKSVDGGARWFPIDDQGSVKNISYLAQAADGSIYAGTGEGFLRFGQKAKAKPGTGLYKLVGNSLQLVESSATLGTVITRVACHPSQPHMAVATNKGIFISINGGAFIPAQNVSTGSLVIGMDVKFSNSGILYCAVGNETGANYGGANTTNVSGKLYKSTDVSLSNFADITPFSPMLPDVNYGRMEIALAASNNDVMYVSCANKNTSVPTQLNPDSPTLKGLFVTYNASSANPSWGLVQQFSSQLDPSYNGSTIASGDYAQALLVNPTNPDQLLMGSYSFYIYTRTGGSNTYPIGAWKRWGQNQATQVQNYLHENIHDTHIVPGNPTRYYFVTDAGIFKSIDLSTATDYNPPTFQPFYRGLTTGQFNSVSIERFPLADSTHETKAGTKIKPYSGFIGGTAGNGLNYYSGKDTVVSEELNYLATEVYNAEYSKILNGAALLSTGSGNIYRTGNVRTNAPSLVSINSYSNSLSKVTPKEKPMNNEGFSSGTAFRLWENYGQKSVTPDSVIFYNDSARFSAAAMTFTDLATKKEFTFSIGRPNNNRAALIDSIVIRSATVIPSNVTVSINVPFVTAQSISMVLPQNYSVSPGNTLTVMTGTNLTVNGPVSGLIQPSVTLNAVTLKDEISVNFANPPFAGKTQTSATIDNAQYYTVFATVFYKYKAGDTVRYVDNSISTKSFTYQTVLNKAMRWDYFGALPVYTLTTPVDPAIPNPTFILNPGNVTQSSPVFTVQPMVKTNYAVTQTGSYLPPLTPVCHTVSALPINVYPVVAVPSITANPLSYTVSAVPNSGISNSVYNISPPGVGPSTSTNPVFTVAPTSPTNYTITQTGTGASSPAYTYSNSIGGFTYVLNPGGITQTTNTFMVSPASLTNYTVSQLGSIAAQAPVTFSSIGTTTYVLNPGGITQTTPSFVVTPTITTTYTVQALSSNTLSAANTRTLYTFLSARTNFAGIGTTTTVPFSPANPYAKMPTLVSAKLAFVLNNTDNTGSRYAVVVSKNPLALNSPMNVVRVSQSGCYSDDTLGNASTSTISIPGKPIVLEWSKSGTELYFATDSNKLYRVSHITDVRDLSSASYSGKFFSDVFAYGSGTLNSSSPYRTTLIGSFDKPVTSISVSNDNKNLVVTFSPVNSGTTGIVLYNSNDARSSDVSNINWVDKTGALSNSVSATYCSLMEKDDNKKVFIGTDNGLYYTSDIVGGSWSNVNDNAGSSKLPYVQVLDIEQQTLDGWDCYNSGQIYVATNGRGVWMNKAFFTPYAVGLDEEEANTVTASQLSIFPNPSNGQVTVVFNSVDQEKAEVRVMDISGRLVKEEDLGKLNSEETSHVMNVSDLNPGVYVVEIHSSAKVKRVSKLVVTK